MRGPLPEGTGATRRPSRRLLRRVRERPARGRPARRRRAGRAGGRLATGSASCERLRQPPVGLDAPLGERLQHAAQGEHAADVARRPQARRAALHAALDRVDRVRQRRRRGDEGGHRRDELLLERVREARLDEIGVDEAEVRAADTRAGGRELDAQGVGHRLDARLGGRVGAHQRRVAGGCQRGDVEQVAAVADDLVEHRAVRAPYAEQVDLDRALELLARHRRHTAHELQAGVGDRDVDATEAGDRAVDGGDERLVVGRRRPRTRPRAARAARRARRACSGSRPTSDTFAPAACSRRALAAPIPRAAPVTRDRLAGDVEARAQHHAAACSAGTPAP